MCGELPIVVLTITSIIGSSPRVWGTRKLHGSTDRSCRFIPACVGNSGLASCPRPAYPVHPRVCGELGTTYTSAGDENGSSPRVWGTRPDRSQERRLGRFIPACVGNSCGSDNYPQCRGSSPRVWGTRTSCPMGAGSARFIPACVGNSPASLPSSECDSVHPRVCGELKTLASPSVSTDGSSPRVWGTLGIVNGRF